MKVFNSRLGWFETLNSEKRLSEQIKKVSKQFSAKKFLLSSLAFWLAAGGEIEHVSRKITDLDGDG